jgi:hypothetical protein
VRGDPGASSRQRLLTHREVADASRSPRRIGLDAGLQVALVLGAVVVYFGVRGLTESDVETATTNAAAVLDFQERLGLLDEATLQSLVIGSDAAVAVLNWIYIWGHWPVIAATLLWLLLRHPEGYRVIFHALLISGAIGICVFVTFPVTPPRLIDIGLVDTITEQSRSYRVLQPPAFTNQYAAVPSLHAGWDLLMGIALFRYAGWRFFRVLGVVMPVAMGMAVVLTGNHYLVDILAGCAAALTGLAIAEHHSRARRRLRAARVGGQQLSAPETGPASDRPSIPGQRTPPVAAPQGDRARYGSSAR